MRTPLTLLSALVLVVMAATAALSQESGAGTAEVALEVYCYLDDLDVSQSEAADLCSGLGEFGLTWEQTLDVLDADGEVLETVLPQLVTDDNSAPYPPDGAWIGREPVLPDGWGVIECPFGEVDEPDAPTNGVGLVIEAEALPYQDRVHVVCYQFTEPEPRPTPSPSPADVPTPRRIDTGAGGTATDVD
jgi:hypothetical protein